MTDRAGMGQACVSETSTPWGNDQHVGGMDRLSVNVLAAVVGSRRTSGGGRDSSGVEHLPAPARWRKLGSLPPVVSRCRAGSVVVVVLVAAAVRPQHVSA